MKLLRLILILCCTAGAARAQICTNLPDGLMLNLNLESAQDGLIPNLALYPLYVPQGSLHIDRIKHRNTLLIEQEDGLEIPHSSLLDPNGDDWIVSIRVFLMSDGLILSQGNAEHGFAIYSKDEQIFARIRTGTSAYTLQENPRFGISKYRKKWVTIELRIEDGRALLSLNRKRAAQVLGQPPLDGEDMRIRVGAHPEIPPVFQQFHGMQTTGFTGAVSSFKIHRQ